MLSLDDPKWTNLTGGYRVPYDPSAVLRLLEDKGGIKAAWEELWNELHHQGDVGHASYAAVPYLVHIQRQRGDLGWNFYSLVSVIEVERRRRNNPGLPPWLDDDYRRAWTELLEIGTSELERTDDPRTIRCILGALALAKGETRLGALMTHLDEDEIDELIEERLEWSQLYS